MPSVPSQIEVRAVHSWSDLRAFIDLPFRLHAGTPWVPPLRLERWLYLNRRLNAYFTHGRAQYFLARRDGRVVGRVSAQIDHAYNAFHGTRTGMFGFLELEDDPADPGRAARHGPTPGCAPPDATTCAVRWT